MLASLILFERGIFQKIDVGLEARTTFPKRLSVEGSFRLVDRTELLKLRLRAMRAGVWFRALRRIDRVLVELVIRVASTVRSASLARSLLSITRKLEERLEGRLTRAMREFGFSLACRLSQLAQAWGNRAARAWMNDLGFVRYLAAMQLNEQPYNG